MASLRELRKRLSSISITKQLAGAMKTVSAAKYTKIEAVLARYTPYAEACRTLLTQYGSALTDSLPCIAPEAPALYVVIASNRGLCGGYNSALFQYTEDVLASAASPYQLFTCGKMAQNYFGDRAFEHYILPDVPEFSDCMPFFDRLRMLYISGAISSITFLYEHFQNMLTQTPCSRQILPFSGAVNSMDMPSDKPAAGDMLFYPDKETVLSTACDLFLHVSLYSIVLEAAAGAQAATLIAMRSANDNAAETAAKLEIAISRKRQAEVTSSVIETASGARQE